MTSKADISVPLDLWPVYFKDRLLVGDKTAPIGVVTLWTPKETVASYLNSTEYAVCGQLYTKGGINYILRNILANPHVQHLVLCGVDRQGSGEALLQFFSSGVERSDESGPWHIVGDHKALIDSQLPLDALESVRKNVRIYDLRSHLFEAVGAKVSELYSQYFGVVPFMPPRIYPEAEKSVATVFPSDRSVFKVRRPYIKDAWLDALKIITRFGVHIPGMYGDVGQVANLAIVVDQEDPDMPQLTDYMTFGEDELLRYYDGFFSRNEDASESYTYGERLFNWDGINQVDIMVEKLKRFEYDRGSMAVLWKPHVDNFPPKGVQVNSLGQTKRWRVPCLVMILGQVVSGDFELTAIFRNNDVFGAWPLNAFALRKLQKEIAQRIGKQMGALTTIAHIAEIYEINWPDASHIVSAERRLDRVCQQDTRSYYVVTVENTDIVVQFYSPDGTRELGEYRKDGTQPKAARDLSLEILSDMLIEDLGASCDLGRQLAKAETAIKLGLHFEQDQPLEFKD